MKPNGIVTLLTDFGTQDHYVAAMKGALVSVAAQARIIDIAHDVPPRSVRAGSFIGGGAWRYFPGGTVHLAVVDPGVGSARLPLVVETPRAWFVGPDNGIFSSLFADELRPAEAGRVALPEGYRCHALAEARFHRPEVSATFHGRDIFAPVAGHVLRGVLTADFGPAVESLLLLPAERAVRTAAGAVEGSVVYVDHFGNLITNVRAEDVPPRAAVAVAGKPLPEGIVRTYAEIAEFATLAGSDGYLEVAAANGSAAKLLGLGPGALVTVHPGR